MTLSCLKQDLIDKVAHRACPQPSPTRSCSTLGTDVPWWLQDCTSSWHAGLGQHGAASAMATPAAV